MSASRSTPHAARRRPRRGRSQCLCPGVRPTRASPASAGRATRRTRWPRAAVRVDHVYTTPAEHNNAMEPHASLAVWDGDDLTVYDSNQGSATARDTLAKTLGIDPDHVRVVNRHVGGGFGSKGTPRPQLVLAAIAARAVGRPVKLAITRQQMFAFVGYRTPTVQRVALGADADGRLTAISPRGDDAVLAHAGVHRADRRRHAPHVRRAAPPHAPPPRPARRPDAVVDARARRVPRHVRPGDRDGRAGDRRRPRPDRAADPQRARRATPRRASRSPRATSSPACARARGASAGTRRRATARPACGATARWLVGTGVAASTYPAYRSPGDRARDPRRGRRLHRRDRRHRPRHRRAHRADPDRRRRARRAGRPRHPGARRLRAAQGRPGRRLDGHRLLGHRDRPRRARPARATATAPPRASATPATTSRTRRTTRATPSARSSARSASTPRTGEVRVRRHLGVFAAGRIINPRTARSQFLGGMTMGIGMALHGGGDHGPQPGRLRQPRPRPVPRARARRHHATWRPRGSTRRTRTSTPWGPRASARSGSPARRPRSPTPSTTPAASACATCRSAWTGSWRRLGRARRRRLSGRAARRPAGTPPGSRTVPSSARFHSSISPTKRSRSSA